MLSGFRLSLVSYTVSYLVLGSVLDIELVLNSGLVLGLGLGSLSISFIVTVLGQRHLLYLVDPDSCQPIRIFHPRDRKSPLARLLLAP